MRYTSLSPEQIDRTSSLKALQNYAKADAKARQDGSRALLVLDKNKTGQYFLKAISEAELGLWEKVKRFFSSKRYELSTICSVANQVLKSIQPLEKTESKELILSINHLNEKIRSHPDLKELVVPLISERKKESTAPLSSPAIVSHSKEEDVRSQIIQKYCQRQKEKGEPIDLIVGRGRKPNPTYPSLVTHRDFHDPKEIVESSEAPHFEGKSQLPYNPLFVDMDPTAKPDIEANVVDISSMSCFADRSVDEIYLEGIYPPSIQVNPLLYINMARILKPGGILLIDFNALCPGTEEARRKSEEVIGNVLFKYGIPLILLRDPSAIPGRRNDYTTRKMAFIKGDAPVPAITTKTLAKIKEELKQAYIPLSFEFLG